MKFTSSYEPQTFEPDIYRAWEESGAFNPQTIPNSPSEPSNPGEQTGINPAGRASQKSKVPKKAQTKYYSLVMPPPNANGNLHIGHGLTIAIEDSLTRFYRLNQIPTWYIPGADHAGFETWVVYERALEATGHTRFEYSRDELYANVWDFVQEQRGNMELQLRALGASCAWDDLTFTLDENVVNRVYQTFKKMWDDGLIYRGEKLVNYCPKHQTAFADIEVTHKDEDAYLYDLKYELSEPCHARDGQAGSQPAGQTSYIVVSTTRPETLFGDTAVAVNPNDKRYKDLIGQTVKLPLTNREIPIIADEHADPEYGTGAVKITPAHDFDDYEVGNRHNLKRIRVIGDDGTMLPAAGSRYAGLTTAECRALVLQDLEEQGILLAKHKINHSVAHCYKCDTVIEPTLKEQWFIDTTPLAQKAIQALKSNQITFFPESKKKALITYYQNLKDWNISRQIPWGIPIPMFKKVGAKTAGTGKQNDPNSPDWIFDTRVNLKEIEVAGVKYVRDEDTFDTWFSSSHWPIVCTDWTEEHGSPFYPLNVMETGADILFAWIARMIMVGLYVTDQVPFKEVYLHGLVLDEHGKKMSKSKGNVINPLDLVSQYGSDAFRFGILRGRSAGLSQAFSKESVITGRNLCNKLWNISRLINSWAEEAGSIEPVNSSSEFAQKSGSGRAGIKSGERASNSNESTPYDTLSMGEDWICRELNQLITNVTEDIKNYRFAEATEEIYSCIWDKYADWFLESQKIFKNIPLLKLSLETLLKVAHPFLPFVTETIWQSLCWTSGLLINQTWPETYEFDPISAESFTRLMLCISEVRRVKNSLPGPHKAKNYSLIYGDDSLVQDNAELVKFLTKCPEISPAKGTPKGIRLALANRELYLDVPEKVIRDYKTALSERILAVGKELNALNARMMNPNYVDKAPAHLVEETRKGIEEKQTLITRLRAELKVIK